MFDKTKLYLHVPGYNRVAGYTLFIPLDKNEKIIEELKAIDGVQLKKNFNESLCQNCGIEFRYFNHGEPTRFCSNLCRVRAYRKKHPPKKRGRKRKNEADL